MSATIDLTAWAPQVQYPRYITPGSQIGVGAYPYSKFGQSARPEVAFVLSADDVYGNGDDILLGSHDVNAITPAPPGWSACYAFPPVLDVTLPANVTAGQYKLFAVVDPNNQLVEYDETNNVSVATDITIVDSAPTDPPPVVPGNYIPITYQPDIITIISDPIFEVTDHLYHGHVSILSEQPHVDVVQPELVTATFRDVVAGSTAKTSFTLANPTSKPLFSRYKVTFYLSDDDKLTQADKSFATRTGAVRLRPGQTKSRQVTYKLPASSRAGEGYVFAVVKPLGASQATVQSPPPMTAFNILAGHAKSLKRALVSAYERATTP